MDGSSLRFQDIHGYGSEFSDCNSEVETIQKQKKKDEELFRKPNRGIMGLLHSGRSVERKPSKRVAHDMLDVEEGKRMRYHGLMAMDAYARHKQLVNDYLFLYGGKYSDFKRDSSRDRTDHDVIKENHRFLWEEDEDASSWEKRLAKRYWDKLYKEYTICDLTRYKENKIAFRWRIEKEVISGKGQFSCSNKHCSEKEGLRSWEVNFAYTEENEKKNALVKSRLCPECSYKLNYHHKKKDVTGKSKQISKRSKKVKHHKKKKKASDSPSSDDEHPSTSASREKKKEDEEHKIWSQPIQVEDEKSREEEFDDYFEGLFL